MSRYALLNALDDYFAELYDIQYISQDEHMVKFRLWVDEVDIMAAQEVVKALNGTAI